VLTAAGFSTYSGTKVTLPSDPAHRMAQVPSGDLGATTVGQAIDAADCTAPSAQSPQDEAGCRALGIDAGVLLYAPDCAGLSVSACQSAFTTAGFTGSVTVDTLSTADANLSYGAGDAVTTEPAVGALTAFNTAITIHQNPDPLPIVWSPAQFGETYDQYVARLQSIGWLGTASMTSLSADGADPRYGVSGVPCTSIVPGDRIRPTDPVNFFRNPTTSFSSTHGSDGGSCGGAVATPPDEHDCEFNDAIGDNPAQGTWEDTIISFGSQALDAECAEAWQMLISAGILNADYTLTASAISDAVDMDLVIAYWKLIDELPKHGSSIEFWRKVFIDNISGVALETQEGHHFELHFYRDIAGNTYTGDDFKIVFTDWFH
jgi:hypothetical protein